MMQLNVESAEWEKIFLKKSQDFQNYVKRKLGCSFNLLRIMKNLFLEKCLKWKRGILLE